MRKEQISDLRCRILQGVDVAHKKLIENRIKDDGNVAISQNGKVVLVKALDLFEKR